MSHLTFYVWIINTHLNDETPIGDLARDMKLDNCPAAKSKGYRRNLNYLKSCHASDGCLAAFEEAWKEYEVYKKGIIDV